MKVSVDWLCDFVKIKPPVERVADRLTMAGLEVKKVHTVKSPKDLLFEVEVTTNRPDWLSHLGIAREIAGVENLKLKTPEVSDSKGGPAAPGWDIAIREVEGCPYYTGVLIEGITEQNTPDFIINRLKACGVRSVNLIVDITNYVLLETGQPLHAFDADLIQGRQIKVRCAKPKENFIAIDESQLTLDAQDLVIADRDNAIALAGVMGGKTTEVNDRTRNVFLESAFFSPRWVRNSSKRHGLTSESSYRFERRVDPATVDLGRDRALFLIKKYAKPRFVSRVLRAGEKPDTVRKSILLNSADVDRSLGIALKPHQVSSILTRLGLNVSPVSGKGWKVQVPSFRADLTRPIDLIEEVSRLHGFENIPETLPSREPVAISKNPMRELEEKTRNFLSGIGFYETVTFSLISNRGLNEDVDLQNAVSITNPQNKELCWMRPFLFPSLLEVIKRNIAWGNNDVFLFEIANVYRLSANGKQTEEERVLGIAMTGKWKTKTWLDAERDVSYYDLKGVISTFLAGMGIGPVSFSDDSAAYLKTQIREGIKIKSEKAGHFGEVDENVRDSWELENPVFVAEISLGKLEKMAIKNRLMEEIPKFPSIYRDISILVREELKTREIVDFIDTVKEPLIRNVEIFDLFRGGRIPKGYKNLGFRITYQSASATLVSSDIQSIHQGIAEKIMKRFEASFQ